MNLIMSQRTLEGKYADSPLQDAKEAFGASFAQTVNIAAVCPYSLRVGEE